MLPDGPVDGTFESYWGIALGGCPKFGDADLVRFLRVTKPMSLSLGWTKVSDAGMATLKGLPNLIALVLTDTKINGTGIENLGILPNLRTIFVNGTALSDADLKLLSRFPSLQSVVVGGPHMTERGIQALSGLPKLNHLEVVGDVQPERIEGLGNLSQVHRFEVHGQFNDVCLEHLKVFSKLGGLILCDSGVTDRGMARLPVVVPQLGGLEVMNAPITDAGLKPLAGMKLGFLRLIGTKVTAAGIADLKAALPNCEIVCTDAVAADNPKSKIENPKSGPPLSPVAIVTQPAEITGVTSWPLETIGHRGGIYEAEYSPDGKWLATLGNDCALRLWDPSTGKLVRIIVGREPKRVHLAVRSGAFGITGLEHDRGAMTWSGDSAGLALADHDAIRFWDVGTAKLKKSLPIEPATRVYKAAWSPDGKTMAVGVKRGVGERNMLVELIDIESGELLGSQPATWVEPEGANGGVTTQRLCWSPDSRHLVFDTSIWDIESGNIKSMLGKAGSSVSWRSDGVLLTAVPTANQDGYQTTELWRPDTGELLQAIRLENADSFRPAPRFSADGGTLVVACWGESGVEGAKSVPIAICDSSSGESKTFEFPSQGEWFLQHVVAPRGESLATFSAHTGQLVLTKPSDGSTVSHQGQLLRSYPSFAAAWSPDGKTLAHGTEELRFWDLESGRSRALATVECLSLRWPNGSGVVRAWLPTGSCAVYDPLTAQQLRHTAVCQASWDERPLSPDGTRIAIAESGRVRIYNTDTGMIESELAADIEARPVWSPDGARLATIGEKTTIWDLASGQQISTLEAAALAEWSPDSKRLVYTFGNGERFEIWDVESSKRVLDLKRDGLGRPSSQSVIAWGVRPAWSPDSTRIAGFGRVWNAASGEIVCALERFGSQPKTCPPIWSPDGKYVAYSALERAAIVADAATGRAVITLYPFTRGRTLAVSPDGHFRASPRVAEQLVYVIETDAGQETLSPQEFADRYGWRNDPSQVGIGKGRGFRVQTIRQKAKGKRQKMKRLRPKTEALRPPR